MTHTQQPNPTNTLPPPDRRVIQSARLRAWLLILQKLNDRPEIVAVVRDMKDALECSR